MTPGPIHFALHFIDFRICFKIRPHFNQFLRRRSGMILVLVTGRPRLKPMSEWTSQFYIFLVLVGGGGGGGRVPRGAAVALLPVG